MIKRFALTIAFTLAAGLWIAGCGGDEAEMESAADNQWQQQPAPNGAQQQAEEGEVSFTLRDPEGNIHTADEWIGQKPVVINFWGTWCAPCRKEIPDMVRIYNEYGDRIEILGIALNDTPDKVQRFATQFGMDWQMLMGTQEVAMDFGIRGIPTTFFFDAQGNMVQVEDYNGNVATFFVGPRDYQTFKRAVETIIAASGSGS